MKHCFGAILVLLAKSDRELGFSIRIPQRLIFRQGLLLKAAIVLDTQNS